MKILVFFSIFLFSSLFYINKSYASLLYSSPLNGTDTFSTDWTLKSGTPTFSSLGLSGTFDYYKDVGSYDQVISFDTVYSAPRLLFACRTNYNYSYIEQLNTINNSSAVNLVEGINSTFYSRGPNYAIPASGNHHYELSCLGNIVVLKIDGTVYQTLIADPLYDTSSRGVRLYSSGPELTISNLKICDSSNCSSPSITLNVPLLKQNVDPWQSQIYDQANKWAPSSPTVGAWGCALASAAMVFQYNGIEKMPNGAGLNPGTLNAWLKSQQDGYIGDGYVNWLALQRLSRLAKLAFNNPSYTADALEWKWLPANTSSQITTDLQNNIPDILHEPGHFVVAKGTQGSTFTINDPFYNKTLLTDYGNAFSYGGHFVPSYTDLSYIMLVGDNTVNFSATTATGSAIGQQITEQAIQNPYNPSQNNGAELHVFYIQQPPDDTYTVTISGSQTYNVKTFDYDSDGNVKTFYLSGSGIQSNPDTYTLTYSKTDNSQDKIEKHGIFDILQNDINQLHQNNELKKNSYKELSEKINEIQKQYDKQHFLQEKVNLAELVVKLVVWDFQKTISDNAYQTLIGDITYLLTH